MSRATAAPSLAEPMDYERPAAWKVIAVLILAEICGTSALAMPIPALSAFLHTYGSAIAAGWIMSSFLLVSASVAALCGSLGDRFGRKPVMMAVLAVVFVGSVMSAPTESFGWVVAGRCLQGAAGATIPLSLGLVREVLPPHRVSFGFGIILASSSAAAALGFPISGYMTDNYGPSSIFWFVALFAAFALVGIGLILPRPVRSDPSGQAIDWVGGIVFAPAIALLLLAISAGRQAGWLADLAWPMAIAGLFLLAFWFRHESRHAAPLINVRLLSNRYCGVGLVVIALVAIGAFQISETVSLLLQQPTWTGIGFGMTATLVGLLKLPTTGAGALSSLATGWFAGRWGPVPCTLAGASIVAASSFAALPFLDSLAIVAVALLTINMGLAVALTSVPVLLALGTPQDRTSEVMGVMAVVRSLFQGVGAQVVAVILASWVVIGPNDVHYPAATAYRGAFVYIGLIAILMILAVIPLLRRGCLRQAQ